MKRLLTQSAGTASPSGGADALKMAASFQASAAVGAGGCNAGVDHDFAIRARKAFGTGAQVLVGSRVAAGAAI